MLSADKLMLEEEDEVQHMLQFVKSQDGSGIGVVDAS
jgi:hypothetical protein